MKAARRVRVSGEFQVKTAGLHQLVVSSRGRLRLQVDGREVVAGHVGETRENGVCAHGARRGVACAGGGTGARGRAEPPGVAKRRGRGRAPGRAKRASPGVPASARGAGSEGDRGQGPAVGLAHGRKTEGGGCVPVWHGRDPRLETARTQPGRGGALPGGGNQGEPGLARGVARGSAAGFGSVAAGQGSGASRAPAGGSG